MVGARNFQFVLSPSENLLAVAKLGVGEGWIVQIWDLCVKEHVATLRHPRYNGRHLMGDRFTFFFLSEHRIVSESDEKFHVFTKAANTHEWLLSGSLDLGFLLLSDPYVSPLNWFPTNEHEILKAWKQHNDPHGDKAAIFYSLRVSTDGSITESGTPTVVEENFSFLPTAGICGRWMVCHGARYPDGKHGVFVYNLETKTRVQTIWWNDHEEIAFLRQSSCCPRAFYAEIYNKYYGFFKGSLLFRLDDRTGQLSWGPLIPVSVPSLCNVDATESHIFHATRPFDPNPTPPFDQFQMDSVSIYNGDTGERERFLRIPMSTTPVMHRPALAILGRTAAKRNELFLANNTEELEVYCLKEPLV